MHPSLLTKLDEMRDRYEEVTHLLSAEETMANPELLRSYGQEHAQLSQVVSAYDAWLALEQERSDLKEMENDPDMRAWVKEELPRNQERLLESERALLQHMIPKDPLDEADIFLEIRAGTGGDEAAIFAGDLFRMYSKFAEEKRWQVEVLSENAGEHGGYKEIITRISGEKVYSTLKYESGAHRVQRIPETESGGRIHTSAATVAVLPESDEVTEIEINSADLRIDTYRASGAGGQHINKTDSAVRITHIPSGMVVECQEERSQHKNRAKAMRLLQARLLDAKRQTVAKEQADTRKSLVGSGDRSERIRTYNYPQSRVTDHRINLTLYNLPEIMQGQLQDVIAPLQQAQEAQALLNLQNQD